MPATNLTPNSINGSSRFAKRQWPWVIGLLCVTLAVFFSQSFRPGWVLFVNDTTLGQMKAPANRLPQGFAGIWHPSGLLGSEGPAVAPTISAGLSVIFPPEIYLKIYGPFTLLFAGFCAWVFFRQLKFNRAVCLVGALATTLNMHFFSVACWGLGTWNIAVGMVFLALAALCSRSIPQLWARAVLAGLAVGMNLMEGFDVGAILSVYVGLFILWQMFAAETPPLQNVIKSFVTEGLVIFFAALIAAHTISTLLSTQVEGVVWTSQQGASDEEHWNAATRWSLPKLETLRIVSPGIFGYQMSQHIPSPDKTAAFWGKTGQDPRITAIMDGTAEQRNTAIGQLILPPNQIKNLQSDDRATRLQTLDRIPGYSDSGARYSGTGEYVGILVLIFAFFALANSWRREGGPFSTGEKRVVWFWWGAVIVSLLASWGRFFPFYRLLYHLPGLSTVRNPIKFLNPLHIGLIILAGYGMEALSRGWLRSIRQPSVSRGPSPGMTFEKSWFLFSVVILIAAVPGVFLFMQWKTHLVEYLVEVGFASGKAIPMADFSVGEARWFVFWLAASLVLLHLALRGQWTGTGAKWVWILSGLIVLLDLGRSDLPWIHYFNYETEYASNSILDFLKQEPYEHRVTGRVEPRGLGSGLNSVFGQVYSYWDQNEFPFHGIQALDYAQWPRMPEMDAAYLKAFSLKGKDLPTADLWPALRLWELSNTRYILSLNPLPMLVNRQADDHHHALVKSSFRVVPKPNLTVVADAGDLTVQEDPLGEFVLMDFTNALPRAKLYSQWLTASNDDSTLQLLLSHDFDPEKTVLVASNTPVDHPAADGKTDPGTVVITGYRPKDIKLHASAATPAVLLLNERIAPGWKVRVDGKLAPLLRCNYLMRGVYLTPGEHDIEFRFRPPLTALYVSLGAWAIGILTAGYLIVSRPKSSEPPAPPTPPLPEPVAPPAAETAPKIIPTPGKGKKRRKK